MSKINKTSKGYMLTPLGGAWLMEHLETELLSHDLTPEGEADYKRMLEVLKDA